MIRPRWTTWVALLLVPVLIAGGLLAGTWRADTDLRRVTAAVVNLDEMVEVNGQMMPLGRQLAAELVDSDREQNLSWILASESRAAEGLASGEYAAVVTIPPEFSAASTSFAKTAADARQATIRVQTSPVAPIGETALGQSIAFASVTSLNGFLTREYLKNIYVGFNDMSASMLELVEGTRQLADGAAELADGAGRSASGAAQLADGLDQAAAGGVRLREGTRTSASGAGQLAAGAGALADGTRSWAIGANQFADGVGSFATGADDFATGMGAYADGVATYAGGVQQYAGGINQILEPVRGGIDSLPEWGGWLGQIDGWVGQAPALADDAVARASEVIGQVRAYVTAVEGLGSRANAVAEGVSEARARAEALASETVECPDGLSDEACAGYRQGRAEAGASMVAGLTSVEQEADALLAVAQTVGPAGQQILDALDRLDASLAELPGWAARVQASYDVLKGSMPEGMPTSQAELVGLLDQLIGAGQQLSAGADQLVGGADGLAVGSRDLANGADGLAGGAQQLAVGAGSLSGGMGRLATGTSSLAGGLGQLATGVDAYTDGIAQAASGSSALASGLGQLADGASALAEGTDELATGVSDGQSAIPTYSDAEREALSTVVDAPVDGSGLDALVRPGLAWASLLLVLALWAGSLATYGVWRPVARDALTSRASTVRLLWDALRPGLVIGALQAVLLTLIGGWVLGAGAGGTVALGGVLLIASAAFVVMNHALAALFGHGGRVVALGLALLTTVIAATGAAPGWVVTLASLAPLTPALEAVRAVGSGTSPVITILTLVGWALIAATGSLAATHRARTVRPELLLAST